MEDNLYELQTRKCTKTLYKTDTICPIVDCKESHFFGYFFFKNHTRRYGPLRQPTSSSCGGLRLRLFWPLTLLTNSRTKKYHGQSKKNIYIQKIQIITKFPKIYKMHKIYLNQKVLR